MKKILWFVMYILSCPSLFSQTKGKIEFRETMKMMMITEDSDVQGDLAEHFPKELNLHKILYYTPELSLYTSDKTKEQDSREVRVDQDNDGPRMIMKIDEPEEEVYCDIKNRNRVEKRDLFGRQFLVESSFDQMEWKLTGNQKRILDYPCQEAILKDSLIDLKVWFSPAIPVSSGPNGMCNLPGMILEAIRDDGKQVITATKISQEDFDESLIRKPSGGKKMNKADFNKLVQEKRKEMEDENGGDNNIIIKIRN